jgi:hypothetical protein
VSINVSPVSINVVESWLVRRKPARNSYPFWRWDTESLVVVVAEHNEPGKLMAWGVDPNRELPEDKVTVFEARFDARQLHDFIAVVRGGATAVSDFSSDTTIVRLASSSDAAVVGSSIGSAVLLDPDGDVVVVRDPGGGGGPKLMNFAREMAAAGKEAERLLATAKELTTRTSAAEAAWAAVAAASSVTAVAANEAKKGTPAAALTEAKELPSSGETWGTRSMRWLTDILGRLL